MPDSYDLTQLNSSAFEHMVNAIAMRELGTGHTGFGPGADGGRDGYFEGRSPYPSDEEQWEGIWYIQSKFHKPSLGTDPQKWIQKQLKGEIKQFTESPVREWPNNWIIATNIDPSGVPETGSFDVLKELVSEANELLASKFHVWGGKKILDLLAKYPDIRDEYGHFLTPGHVLTELMRSFGDEKAHVEEVIRELVVPVFKDEIHTKLDQAGSDNDSRPGIHKLFIDLPYLAHTPGQSQHFPSQGTVLDGLSRASNRNHGSKASLPSGKKWLNWLAQPERSSVWFVIGGPGQGKSTLGQYYCQIQRAAIILDGAIDQIHSSTVELAEEVREAAIEGDVWPTSPRIPVAIELREYSHWLARREADDAKGLLTYVASILTNSLEKDVNPGLLQRALAKGAWFFAFDGLDEVPGDTKAMVAREIQHFVEEIAVRNNCDLQSLCTSRPQGYSGEFNEIQCATIRLRHLHPEEAFLCAKPVLCIGRSKDDITRSEKILESALKSPAVQDLMKTPLQSHIMAVVVRDGNKPPERRWQLFNNFYEVIRRREANKELADPDVAKLLRENENLLRSIHNRLGFVLHAEAESASGATTSLSRERFRGLAEKVVNQMLDDDGDQMVNTLMEATTNRLVLVNTPDDGEYLRFDVRQLQEFFAAEYIYESVVAGDLQDRLQIIFGDSHWREVSHFVLSALIENKRQTELAVAIDVLRSLDGVDPGALRLTDRRLGRGALAASRLIEEGVLEQDKRVRQGFRSCFDAACSFTSMDSSTSLASVVQPRSRTWLVNYLVDELKERAESESIGAYALLFGMLDPQDEKWEWFSARFRRASSHFQDAVFACFRTYVNENAKIRSEKATILIERMIGDSWTTLSASTLECICSLLGQSSESLEDLAGSMGLSDPELRLLRILVESGTHPTRRSRHHRTPVDENCDLVQHGPVACLYAAADWSTEIVPECDKTESTRGFLGFLSSLERFASYRNKETFVAALTKAELVGWAMFREVPSEIRCQFPALECNSDLAELIEQLDDLDDSQFLRCLSERKIGNFRLKRWASSFQFDPGKPIADFVSLVKERPAVAMQVWFGGLLEERFGMDFDKQKSGCQDVLNAFQHAVSECVSPFFVAPGLWGRMIDSLPDPDAFREELTANCMLCTTSYAAFIAPEMYPFRLRLPNESKLLPHLANSVIGLLNHRRSGAPGEEASKHAAKVAKSYAELDQLGCLVESMNASDPEKLAAVLLQVVINGELDFLIEKESLVVNTLSGPNTASARSIAGLIRAFGSYANDDHRGFAGKILETVRDNYGVRRIVEQAVCSWREKPTSPLQRSGKLPDWLDGTE
ncbi:hypothetical protein [Planctomycetes bacterium K23_9]